MPLAERRLRGCTPRSHGLSGYRAGADAAVLQTVLSEVPCGGAGREAGRAGPRCGNGDGHRSGAARASRRVHGEGVGALQTELVPAREGRPTRGLRVVANTPSPHAGGRDRVQLRDHASEDDGRSDELREQSRPLADLGADADDRPWPAGQDQELRLLPDQRRPRRGPGAARRPAVLGRRSALRRAPLPRHLRMRHPARQVACQAHDPHARRPLRQPPRSRLPDDRLLCRPMLGRPLPRDGFGRIEPARPDHVNSALPQGGDTRGHARRVRGR
jgi:hypothetical protein